MSSARQWPPAGALAGLGGILLSVALAAGAEEPPAAGRWDPTVEKRWDRRPASLGIENAYRDTLAAWARGVEAAAPRYADFQVQVVEGIIGTEVSPGNLEFDETQRALSCLEATEENAIRLLKNDDPETLPVVFAFQLEVYLHQLTLPRRIWVSELGWARLDGLWRSFRSRPSAPPRGSDEMLALLHIETGARLEELGIIGHLARAREAFERAIEHSPDSVAARYRAGFLAEKLGLYRRAHRQFDWLVERRPADHEVRLRRALTAARLGTPEDAEDELRVLAGGSAPDWIRAVAYQELARGIAAADAGAAIEILREAEARLPGRQAIEVFLAHLLGAGSEEGRRRLETVLDRDRRWVDGSARGDYEEGRKEEVREAQERFAAELARRTARLLEALDRIERFENIQDAYRRHRGADPNPVRKVFFECRGYKNREARGRRR